MPIITITLIEGYDADLKHRLCQRFTDIATGLLGASPEGVTVVVNEVLAENYMRGRSGKRPAVPPRPATEVVRTYLDAMERRDLDAAQALTGPGFEMVFPGGARFDSLAAMVDWSRGRYSRIGKTIDSVDECFSPQEAVVIVSGRLHGNWPDERPFTDIRFIDRFVLRGGQIVHQQVWNDLAEAHAKS